MTRKSTAFNPAEPQRPTIVERDGKILFQQRRRVLIPRRQAWIGQELREQGVQFELVGEEEVSVFGPTNPLGVFDLVSDTPAVWVEKASPPVPVAPPAPPVPKPVAEPVKAKKG